MIAYSADASCLKTPQLTRRTNLNIRLADQNLACAGQPHERGAQFSVTTVEPLNYQLTTGFDGLGKHRNLPVLLPNLGQGHWHQTTKKAP
jgi:hypothetical protein